MEPLIHRRGNLLESNADFLAHQCNCVTTQGKGLAVEVFRRFPEANIYHGRRAPSTPGRNVIGGRIINMLAQYYPGQARGRDSAEQRRRWFLECLDRLAHELPLLTAQRPLRIAFPWRVGCGLGGGSWDLYLEALRTFARTHAGVIQVEIYQLPSDTEGLPDSSLSV